MGVQQGRERRPDPWSVLTEGMRQLSRLDLGDIRRGFENLAYPSAAGMLESLGPTRQERVEKMAAMLRNSSEDDISEMGTVFGLAMAKLAQEQAPDSAGRVPDSAGRVPARHRSGDDRPRRRRGQTAADWRAQRRALRPAP